MKNNTYIKERLIKHSRAYPSLQIEDIFKYIFQSAFGCEHLVTDEEAALDFIRREYASSPSTDAPSVERLDGDYSRVFLSSLGEGLKAETLARLLCLSAKREENGKAMHEEMLLVARALVLDGTLPLNPEEFDTALGLWRAQGFPAIHHSAVFREAYHPAYRVIDNRYADFLEVFAGIDKRLSHGPLTVAIEGGSGSGKTTLAGILKEVYDCNIIHMDDFFLRPEQRTPERLSEVGGNIDRERFLAEVVAPLRMEETVTYRPYDCTSQTLMKPISLPPKSLTVIEGVYSLHPAFSKYYGLSIFLDISQEQQRERILKRNSERLAKRFFEEWIPLENSYFSKMQIKEKADLCLP